MTVTLTPRTVGRGGEGRGGPHWQKPRAGAPRSSVQELGHPCPVCGCAGGTGREGLRKAVREGRAPSFPGRRGILGQSSC